MAAIPLTVRKQLPEGCLDEMGGEEGRAGLGQGQPVHGDRWQGLVDSGHLPVLTPPPSPSTHRRWHRSSQKAGVMQTILFLAQPFPRTRSAGLASCFRDCERKAQGGCQRRQRDTAHTWQREPHTSSAGPFPGSLPSRLPPRAAPLRQTGSPVPDVLFLGKHCVGRVCSEEGKRPLSHREGALRHMSTQAGEQSQGTTRVVELVGPLLETVRSLHSLVAGSQAETGWPCVACTARGMG